MSLPQDLNLPAAAPVVSPPAAASAWGVLILKGPGYVIQSVDALILQMWGRTPAQTLGKPLFEALPELAGQGFEALLLGVYTTGAPFMGKELPGELLRDGRRETLYFDFIYLPIRDEAGHITGITVVATDATGQVLARQKAERDLRESRQREQAAYAQARLERDRLYALFMQAPLGIGIYTGKEHRVELVNPVMSGILGRAPEALRDKPLFEALPEVRGQGFEAILAGVFATGTTFEANEIAATLERDGALVPGYYNTVYQALKDEGGQVTGIIQIVVEVTAQVMARRAVEENARRFRTLLESVPQMAWTATAEGELDYFNAQWYAYTGQQPAEALERGWTDVTHPDDAAAASARWQQSLREHTPYQVECRYRRADDGSWRWHLIRAVPLRGEAGAVFGWVGTCTDIHEQKRYAEQLLERETYFREMADNVPVMIWVTDPDGSCTYLNNPWFDYTGQTGEEALGLGWLSATHPDDAAQSAEVFLAANARQEPFALLYRLRDRGGNYRWFLDKGEPAFDPLGGFEGYVGVVIDVHEQHLAEQQLQLSVKAGRVGIWEWDTVHDRATYSALLREMFGLEAAQYEGEFGNAYQVFQRVVHPEDWPEVNRRVSKVLHNQEASFYVEFRAVKPSGERIWIAERGQGVFEGGRAVRMNGTCIDITDAKRAGQEAQRMSEELAALNEEMAASNEELRAANEELGHSNRRLASINADLDTFVYTASHDLKSPILNIEGLLRAMERQTSKQTREEKNVQHIYELLYGSVARFKSTIRDLTEVARASKETPEDAASIPLAGVLAEVCQDLAPQIAEAGARIDEQLDCSPVYFSKKNLKSVLYNLLSNAVKYRSPDRPLHIRITCYELPTHHVLTVADNGLGMDMRHEDKIFALFKRLHNHVEGTGIGLYIVKKMLENAGGGIEVESRVGAGSTFRVYFKR